MAAIVGHNINKTLVEINFNLIKSQKKKSEMCRSISLSCHRGTDVHAEASNIS
jgi:hypothetical protein